MRQRAIPRCVPDRRRLPGLCLALILAAAGAIALSACRREARLTDEQLAGKHLYQVRCAHCHEENDLALKKVPPDLHSVFRNSKLPSGVPATDADVRRVVLSGKGLMPSFAGRFTDDQMAELLAYLHTGLK